jgi:uncharacterized protein (DUF1697 family)
MPRYVAFLRGVSPMNAKMPDLVRAFESAGFTDVRTVLSSGNVVFDARKSAVTSLERKAVKAMEEELGRSFGTIVRPVEELEALLESDPFSKFRLPSNAKRVVTFLRKAPAPPPKLPIERDGATILEMKGAEVFTVYVPGSQGPVFMELLEKTFGKDITTRTLDTVRKCAKA